MEIYSINKKLLRSYAKREALNTLKIGILASVLLLGVFFLLSYPQGVNGFIPVMFCVFTVLNVIVFLLGLSSNKKRILITEFHISKNRISVLVNIEKLGPTSQILNSFSELKYGKISHFQNIEVGDIYATYIKKDDIEIISLDNMKLSIPKELENFDIVKTFIQNEAKLFKVQPIF